MPCLPPITELHPRATLELLTSADAWSTAITKEWTDRMFLPLATFVFFFILFASILVLVGHPKWPACSNGTPVGDHLINPLSVQGPSSNRKNQWRMLPCPNCMQTHITTTTALSVLLNRLKKITRILCDTQWQIIWKYSL